MTRLLFAFGLIAAMGCTGIQGVGPLAGLGTPSTTGKEGTDLLPPPPDPVKLPPPKLTPPANLVDPSQVTTGDPYVVAQMLMTEYETDRKTMPSAPMTAEVSYIKGRVK